MHEVCDVMGITKTRTTAYHHQCDGQVQRKNSTLQDMLVPFCTKHGNDWDLWLNAVVFAYITGRQESLQTSPFEIAFGRIPRLPLELELGLPLKDPSTQSEYTQSLRKIFKEVREVARQNLKKARKKTRRNITKKKFRHGTHSPQGRQYTYANRKDGNWGRSGLGHLKLFVGWVLITK